jgi:hypothetical protein
LKAAREEAKDKRNYLWRKNFPKCTNIYVNDEMRVKDAIYNPYPKNSELFFNGGVAFYNNPFKGGNVKAEDVASILFNGFYSHIKGKPKTLTLDDLADGSLSKVDMSRQYRVERKVFETKREETKQDNKKKEEKKNSGRPSKGGKKD